MRGLVVELLGPHPRAVVRDVVEIGCDVQTRLGHLPIIGRVGAEGDVDVVPRELDRDVAYLRRRVYLQRLDNRVDTGIHRRRVGRLDHVGHAGPTELVTPDKREPEDRHDQQADLECLSYHYSSVD
jgi:hypothetical protein